MSQSAQEGKVSSAIGFTSVQAYTLAIITLVIGIAVGYFARGSAPATASPGSGPVSTGAAAPADGAGMASGQLPGIGTQQQGATSPEMLAQAAGPLLAKLKANPNDVETLRQLGNIYYDGQAYPQAIDYYSKALADRPQEPRRHHRSGHRLLVHRRSRQGHR